LKGKITSKDRKKGLLGKLTRKMARRRTGQENYLKGKNGKKRWKEKLTCKDDKNDWPGKQLSN
jgi:hypothetical protein